MWVYAVLTVLLIPLTVDFRATVAGIQHYRFVWNTYRCTPSLLTVKSICGLPYTRHEPPWKTYAELKQHFKETWPYRMIVEPDGNVTLEDETTRKPCVNMSSFSYLGADQEPAIRNAVVTELRNGKYTTGNPGQRGLGGNNPWLRRLERKLALFCNREGALVFSAGYIACRSVGQAVTTCHDLLLVDAGGHEALAGGATSSGCKVLHFRHNDTDHLHHLLRKHRKHHSQCYIAIESVYPLEGNTGDLATCVKLGQIYDAKVILDESHGLGTLGPTGRGLTEVQNCQPWLTVGSLAKAFGSVGGYVVGDQPIIDFLHFFATMTASPIAPPCAVAACKVLDKLILSAEWVEETRKNVEHLVTKLRTIEHNKITVQSEPGAPLVAFVMEDFTPLRVFRIARELYNQGFYVATVVTPACDIRRPRFRLTAPRTLDTVDVNRFVKALETTLFRSTNDPILDDLRPVLDVMGV